jgi:hypothetical protein
MGGNLANANRWGSSPFADCNEGYSTNVPIEEGDTQSAFAPI